jgi:beta-glucosidase
MTLFDAATKKETDRLLSELTLDEKVSLVSGQDFWSLPAIERLGIPSLKMSDGPTGLRSTNSDPATVFPVGTALAATWDPTLVQDVSSAIGREAIAHGVDVLLAPGVNIQRTPLGGRNFEYYSEDPYLTGEIGCAYVSGVQSVGIGTSVKHFVANNQEYNRMAGSSNMSKRALREIYLAAFEPIIKRANPWTVMSAYNRINGTFASEHDGLLNKVLKQEWGYDGVVVSDWGAAKSTVGSANGGLDLEMPGPAKVYGANLLRELAAGIISEETLDDHVLRILRLIVRCGLLDG